MVNAISILVNTIIILVNVQLSSIFMKHLHNHRNNRTQNQFPTFSFYYSQLSQFSVITSDYPVFFSCNHFMFFRISWRTLMSWLSFCIHFINVHVLPCSFKLFLIFMLLSHVWYDSYPLMLFMFTFTSTFVFSLISISQSFPSPLVPFLFWNDQFSACSTRYIPCIFCSAQNLVCLVNFPSLSPLQFYLHFIRCA